MRAFLVGRRPCRGIPVDYFLLVEERDALWERYGIRVESGGERTEIPRDHRLAVRDPVAAVQTDAGRGDPCRGTVRGGGLVVGIACSPAAKESGEIQRCASLPDRLCRFCQGHQESGQHRAQDHPRRQQPPAGGQRTSRPSVVPVPPAAPWGGTADRCIPRRPSRSARVPWPLPPGGAPEPAPSKIQ